LRFGPEELIGHDENDNAALARLQRIFSDVQLPATSKIRRSRLVLAAYCHDRFEAENRELFTTVLRLPITDFVPPGFVGPWDLAELDDLWRPDASPAEIALLHRALRAALNASEGV
jgi:hypothetical protein